MQLFNIKRSKFNLFVAASLGGMVLALPGTTTYAVDSAIGVSVCGPNAPGASIAITQPISDSVVSESPTTFRGTVSNASQIEVQIDSQYVTTLALGAQQTTFATDLSLSKGTHTIEMIANDICGGAAATDSVVITYTPVAQPTTGDTTPTQIGGGVTVGGDDVQATDTGSSFLRDLEQVPILGGAVNTIEDFVRASGLESTVTTNTNGVSAVGVARVVLTSAGLVAVVMATNLAPLVKQIIPASGSVTKVIGGRSLRRVAWLLRGGGLIALAFTSFL